MRDLTKKILYAFECSRFSSRLIPNWTPLVLEYFVPECLHFSFILCSLEITSLSLLHNLISSIHVLPHKCLQQPGVSPTKARSRDSPIRALLSGALPDKFSRREHCQYLPRHLSMRCSCPDISLICCVPQCSHMRSHNLLVVQC